MKTNIFAKKIRLLGTLAVLIVILMAQTNLVLVRAQDSTAPVIYIISPESTTYSTGDVDLTFTLNEEVSWIGYSLDGADNQTITGNVTLSSLSDGSHSLIVYATDLVGNTGASNVVNFDVLFIHLDTVPPVIEVLSPREPVYPIRNVFLNFSLSEEVSWIGYSLDGASNVTLYGNSTIIWALDDGPHSLVVYATDTSQNTGKSNVVNFSIDTRAPVVMVWPPGNTTYTTSDIGLVINLNEEVSWIGYSLDGADNQTITGNVTLSSLSEGSHNIVVYATDTLGHTGKSKTVFFSIDTTLPVISIISPINSTYSESSVDLNFTVGEEVSWTRYSLDGARNQTIGGNVTLSSLSDGSHNIVVYATDAANINTGNSSVVYFSVDTTPPLVVVDSPINNATYTTNNVSLSFTVNENASLKYSLDGKDNITIFDSTFLYNVTNGKHYLIIYAEDLYGNSGATGIISFTVDVERILQPLEIVIASAIILVGFSVVIIIRYRKKS
ncbi:MAG: hypothetical protein IAX21_01860 [Candidatus Bathyarchaeota archaeon]|nr:MAG: hypothetical protein IAX21_01860 [Candidatus Bathyarchaeota archaeon]